MLGRHHFTRAEIDAARDTLDAQLAAFRDLPAGAEKDALEPTLFTALTLQLDRFFVHRTRRLAGTGTSALNELELISECLLRDGIFRPNSVIAYDPARAIVKLRDGDAILLTESDLTHLAAMVFHELDEQSPAPDAESH